MKKTYFKPTAYVVKLQSQSTLLQASIQSCSTNLTGSDAIGYGGSSDNYNDTNGQGIRTKESGGIWDEEW